MYTWKNLPLKKVYHFLDDLARETEFKRTGWLGPHRALKWITDSYRVKGFPAVHYSSPWTKCF